MLQNDAIANDRFDVRIEMPEIQASDWVIANVKFDLCEKYFFIYNATRAAYGAAGDRTVQFNSKFGVIIDLSTSAQRVESHSR